MARSNQGFTLIEILVVMLIIGIASSIIVLRVGDFYLSNKRSEVFAREVTALIELARNQAIFSMNTLGLQISDQAFTFERLDDTNGISWKPMGDSDSFWAVRNIPKNLIVTYHVEGNNTFQNTAFAPQIIILSSGELTPFTISIHRQGSAKIDTITGTYAGHVEFSETK